MESLWGGTKNGEGLNKRTLAPLLVEEDDMVDEGNVGEAAALGLPDALGVVALLLPKQVDIQHPSFSALFFLAVFFFFDKIII